MGHTFADIAIIGGGASGAVTAANLMRKGFAGKVAIISRDPQVGRGIAYGTDELCHLLNVRAANMSAFADQPSDFVDWLIEQGLPTEGLAQSFQPRTVYGTYIQARLGEASKNGTGTVTTIHAEATSVDRSPEGFRVAMGDGTDLKAEKVVFALGNLAPYTPRECQSLIDLSGWVANPWVPGALDGIEPTDEVLILGTGLSMVDLILSLRTRGHTGRIYARSRHGLLSHRHAPAGSVPNPPPQGVKELIGSCRDAGAGWRGVVDSIRPLTPRLWAEMSWGQRQRLLWRLMPYWNVHRHRVPPDVADLIEGLVEKGILDIASGTIVSAVETKGWIWVQFNSGPVRVKHFINATGPSCNWKQAKVPLIESAIANGLATMDPLGQGIIVDEDGRTEHSGKLLAIGPICRGCRLETTAMPEIRVQAARAAQLLID